MDVGSRKLANSLVQLAFCLGNQVSGLNYREGLKLGTHYKTVRPIMNVIWL